MFGQVMRRAAFAAVTAVTAVLAIPVARADDPDCDTLPPEQVQQCQQQKAAGIAKQATGDVQNGIDRAKQGAGQGQKPIDLSDKNCWLINGVPTMWSPGLATTVGQTAEPCYSHFGLTPH